VRILLVEDDRKAARLLAGGLERRPARARLLDADPLLTARDAVAIPPGKAALAVGPDNVCVYCHRTDGEWR
jgi:hypothetical protein